MKKKLDDAYLPDEVSRPGKIIVGLSGGLNSFVAAYLLKIQKMDLIAVTVAITWDSFKGDTQKVLSCALGQPEIDKIKEFCQQLGIPHILVKAADEFKEDVVEAWMASRLTGSMANPCWSCHDLRMNILLHKAQEFEAQGVATGHLAKVFRQSSHGTVFVHTANDEGLDQSSLISTLSHELLEKLILPLSDLQQKEVIKLGENFGLTPKSKLIQMHECFPSTTVTDEYIETHVPESLRKSGSVMDPEDKIMHEHQGVFRYVYGGEVGKGGVSNEPLYFSHFFWPLKRIDTNPSVCFIKEKVFLTHCSVSEGTSWMEPLQGFIKRAEGEYVECWIHPKNLNSALLEFEAPIKIKEGEIVTLQKRRGKNAKIYLSGKVKYLDLPVTEEGNERVKVDHSTDF